MDAVKMNYRVSIPRGPNALVANPQRLTSADGKRWATGRTVKGEGADPHTYIPVEVWTLKERGPDGKAITVETHRSREDAVTWVEAGGSPVTLQARQQAPMALAGLERMYQHGEALTRVIREARKVVRALPPSCPVGLVSLLQAVEGLEAVENALAGQPEATAPDLEAVAKRSGEKFSAAMREMTLGPRDGKEDGSDG